MCDNILLGIPEVNKAFLLLQIYLDSSFHSDYANLYISGAESTWACFQSYNGWMMHGCNSGAEAKNMGCQDVLVQAQSSVSKQAFIRHSRSQQQGKVITTNIELAGEQRKKWRKKKKKQKWDGGGGGWSPPPNLCTCCYRAEDSTSPKPAKHIHDSYINLWQELVIEDQNRYCISLLNCTGLSSIVWVIHVFSLQWMNEWIFNK